MREVGTKTELTTEQILELFAPVEGVVACYYGKIRNGKTRNATADILELLDRGEVVVANWQIEYVDFDERSSFKIALASLFGNRKYFYKYKNNFHYVSPDDLMKPETIKWLASLVNCHIFIDEGQWIFNSHLREQDPEKRKLILHNGHYCRSLNIITQRPINIFKDMRSQVNVWYRCVKRFDAFGFMIFQRWAIEDMKNDEPVEFEVVDGNEKPLGECKTYFVNKKHDKVFKSYNTHAMRQADAIELMPSYDVFATTFFQRVWLTFMLFFGGRTLKRPASDEHSVDNVGDSVNKKIQ